jgi:hypothetical protein
MNYPLFHFSEDPTIERFVPRPVKTPVSRPKGLEWLNGPLVWAIDAENSPVYVFPRECPRIVMSKGDGSTTEDVESYWSDPSKASVAFIENGWLERIENAKIFRYVFERDDFDNLQDVGMHVTDKAVLPQEVVEVVDLLSALRDANVEVHPLPDFSGLRDAWESSLQVNGIRLRNARNWSHELFWLRP